uniref:Uncharacterized protein n=1 Tax=Arundo donax TaxID=35708 RepID=A0A0A9EGY9_ARUDO
MLPAAARRGCTDATTMDAMTTLRSNNRAGDGIDSDAGHHQGAMSTAGATSFLTPVTSSTAAAAASAASTSSSSLGRAFFPSAI